MELEGPLQQVRFILDSGWIGQAALDGTDHLASLLLMKTYAFGAESGVDDIYSIALRNRFVGAFGLAGATVYAFFGDVSGHEILVCGR